MLPSDLYFQLYLSALASLKVDAKALGKELDRGFDEAGKNPTVQQIEQICFVFFSKHTQIAGEIARAALREINYRTCEQCQSYLCPEESLSDESSTCQRGPINTRPLLTSPAIFCPFYEKAI